MTPYMSMPSKEERQLSLSDRNCVLRVWKVQTLLQKIINSALLRAGPCTYQQLYRLIAFTLAPIPTVLTFPGIPHGSHICSCWCTNCTFRSDLRFSLWPTSTQNYTCHPL